MLGSSVFKFFNPFGTIKVETLLILIFLIKSNIFSDNISKYEIPTMLLRILGHTKKLVTRTGIEPMFAA